MRSLVPAAEAAGMLERIAIAHTRLTLETAGVIRDAPPNLRSLLGTPFPRVSVSSHDDITLIGSVHADMLHVFDTHDVKDVGPWDEFASLSPMRVDARYATQSSAVDVCHALDRLTQLLILTASPQDCLWLRARRREPARARRWGLGNLHGCRMAMLQHSVAPDSR